MSKTPQNIYDNPEFFQGYLELRSSDKSFNRALDQPTMRGLLPNLTGLSIIDLGCGFGDLCRYMREQGAASVLGIDISENMLNLAKAKTQDKNINYQRMAIEDFSVSAESIDVVVSSLVLHYVADYSAVVEKIYRCLKPGGHLMFSVEHPVCTANPSGQMLADEQGVSCFPVMNYRDERKFTQTWLVEGVQKYHRTVQTYINTLIATGFTLLQVLEPMPTDEQIAKWPHFVIFKIRPSLLVISAIKN